MRDIGVFLLVFFVVSTSYSQEFSLGLKAGPLIAWNGFGDKDDKANFSRGIKPGFTVGALINFPLKNEYSFQTEFAFAQRGRKVNFNSDTWENNATYYFYDGCMMLRRSFPLNLGENIPANWFANIGPRVSYWISGKGVINAGGSYSYQIKYEPMPVSPTEPDFDIVYVQDFNRFLFGLDLGIGFNASLGQSRTLFTELRFTSGHTFFGQKNSTSNRTLGYEDNLLMNEKVLSLTFAYVLHVNVKENRKGKSTKDKEVNRKRIKH